MKLKIGIDDYAFKQKKEVIPVEWDSDMTVNGHILLVGKSGTGKTHTLRNLISSGISDCGQYTTFHVMDVHGDIDIPRASSVVFSEATTYGLNPFKVNPDLHFGGIRKRTQSFLSTINRTSSRVLGPKQEAVLRNLIVDLYAANGFYADNPDSWKLKDGVPRKYPKRFPNVEDLYRFAFAKLKQIYLGTDNETIKSLEEVHRKTASLQRNLKKKRTLHDEEEIDKLDKQIDKLKEQCIAHFSSYITALECDYDFEAVIKYDSYDILKSVVDRIENLRAAGIFKNQLPPFDPDNPVWRYDICALREEEKRMFVEFSLQDIFSYALQRGPVDVIHDVIILDEAHLFFKDDEDNILNTIAKEGRKFGIALVCASQSPTHFSDDFVANVATKIVLGIDQMYWDGAARKMRIESKILEYLVPQKTIALQINNKGATKVAFKQVYVGRY